jgi:hypothetical protein
VSKLGTKYMCTCPGFTFRHTCKHIAEMNKWKKLGFSLVR